jgi:3-oxoacyl-[acyl-carrier-protein] synthase-1
MKGSPVFIASAGTISAIGGDVASSLASLEKGEAGMGEITMLETIHRGKLPVAEVRYSNDELAAISGLSPKLPRTALLAAVAAEEALNNAGLKNLAGLKIGFISANTVGGMDKTEHFFKGFLTDHASGHLHEVVNHECGTVSEIVADHLGIKHYISTISTACSSSANAIFFGARLIKHGYLDAVVAGGADALTRFTLNGFNTLMILDQQWCKPFDENRRGLNLGEGAGYLVLVSEKLAARLPAPPTVILSGYANANDAYHQTASSPDGTGSFLAMSGALAMSGVLPAEISYINLHGTGTQNNDIAEGTAIKRIFDPNYPLMSSTKSFTGHTLGASGGIEAVYSVLALQHDIVFPNLRFETRIQDLPFEPVTKLQKGKRLKHVLSNSFGFGGNCSSLIFSKS